VSYLPVEKLIEKLCTPYPFGNRATLAISVGYLTPEENYLEWIFDPTNVELTNGEIAKVGRAIEEYGLPFMQGHTDMGSIIAELESKRYTVNDLRRYRLPAAYLLAGRRDDALSFIEKELEAMRGRSDAAALAYLNFARALGEQ
jgi:hypothetical protein